MLCVIRFRLRVLGMSSPVTVEMREVMLDGSVGIVVYVLGHAVTSEPLSTIGLFMDFVVDEIAQSSGCWVNSKNSPALAYTINRRAKSFYATFKPYIKLIRKKE